MNYAAPVKCARCPRTAPGDKWGRIRASGQGWFFSREEDAAYCPDHIPDWVAGWRKRKEEEQLVHLDIGPLTGEQLLGELLIALGATAPGLDRVTIVMHGERRLARIVPIDPGEED
jgi:hypothetical protein